MLVTRAKEGKREGGIFKVSNSDDLEKRKML